MKKQTNTKATSKLVVLNKVTAPPIAKPAASPSGTKSPSTKQELKTVAIAKPLAVAKANSGAHLKKDGTPDMRFKANKKHS